MRVPAYNTLPPLPDPSVVGPAETFKFLTSPTGPGLLGPDCKPATVDNEDDSANSLFEQAYKASPLGMMLCGIHSPSSHHHHGFLRSFRSHRALRHRDDSNSISSNSQETMHHHHSQRPSDASSPARPSFSSSSRPSTSSSSRAGSIDWDSLRMNPPSLAPGLASPLQDTTILEDTTTSRPYQPHELRHALVSSNNPHSQPPPSPRHATTPTPSSNTVIYDGFDFGFNNTPTPATALNTPSRGITPTARGRTPSLTPSDASSECSLSLSGWSDDAAPSPLEEMGLYAGLAPAPAPRARPRPRPRFESAAAGGLDGDAEEYIRRGGWKRRGIVFVDVEVELGEDEAFEI